MADQRGGSLRQGSKLRRFSCPQCSSSFTRAAHLRRHQLAHLGKKPFFCAFCPVSSSRKDVIVRHTKKIHQNMSRKILDRDSGAVEQHQPSVMGSSCAANGNGSSSQIPELAGSRTPDAAETSLSEVNQQSQQCQLESRRRDIDELSSNNFAFPVDENTLANELTPITSQLLDSFCQSLRDEDNAEASVSATQLPNLTPANEDAIGFHLLTDPYSNQPKTPSNQPFSLNDEDYTKAKDDVLTLSLLSQRPASDWFPSKYTVVRFVKSFFDNMAPHTPIVHEATFRIATVEPPLLLQVMACGAVYLGEHDIADEMHKIASQLVTQDHLLPSVDRKDGFQLWVLQVLLLINVYHVCSTPLLLEQQEIRLFPHIIRLAGQALKEPQTSPSNYQQWVYEETVSRCISYTIFLGAIYISTTRDGSVAIQFLDGSFPLPSHTTAWVSAENWINSVPDRLEYSATLSSILSGLMPPAELSDLGLLAIASAILCRISLFGHLCVRQPNLYSSYVSQMEQPLQILHNAWIRHKTKRPTPGSAFDSLTQCIHAVLNSAYYHLYGYQALNLMKGYLYAPESLLSLASFSEPLNDRYIAKGLIMAANAWRDDCRAGLGYLERFAPYRYSPLLAISVSERALIILWYYATRPLNQLTSEQCFMLESLMMQGISEFRGSTAAAGTGEITTLPAITYMKCLKEATVWLFPSVIAGMMKRLIERIEVLLSIERQASEG